MSKSDSFFALDYAKLIKDFDPMKGFQAFDPSKFDVAKIFRDFKVPGVNMDQFLEIQKKNVEALNAANQVAAEGVQALAKRQTEIIRQSFEAMGEAMKDLIATPSPEANAAKQTEIAKHTFERAVSNVRELTELAAKSNTEALEVINQRICCSLDEVKELLPKQK